jgi:chromosome segregation ATPase
MILTHVRIFCRLSFFLIRNVNALVVLCLLGTIWGSVQNKKSTSLERQLVAMRQDAAPAAAVVDEAAAEAVTNESQAVIEAAQAEAEELKSQNKGLLANVATLKGSLASQKEELAGLAKEMKEADGGVKAIEAMQAQLDEASAGSAKLGEALAAAKAEFDEKSVALAAAEEAAAGFEDVKSTLANTVDAYSLKSQELSAEVEKSAQMIRALENALEERTKLLIANGEELGRTRLNMNVLLSKIAAQNKSLAILEETRVALEKELTNRFQIIEELQHQLSAQVVVEDVIEEAPVEEAPAH